MAEIEPEIPVAADTEAAAPTNGEGKSDKKPQSKRDEVPIEELFDLSKPIPRVSDETCGYAMNWPDFIHLANFRSPRTSFADDSGDQVEKPNKEAHDKELQELTDAIEKIKADRGKVQEKIDEAMADPEGKSGVQETRNKVNELKTKKNQLIEEKKILRNQLDQAKSQTDKLIKDKKDVRSNIKFSSVEEIDKEIARLQRTQETTTMSLNEEKKLIKDIDALKASKKYINELKAKETSIDGVIEERKNIAERIRIKDKEIDEMTKQMDQYMTTIKSHSEDQNKKRDAIQNLLKERDEFKKQINLKMKERDAMRDEFRKKNNDWYNNQRAIRAQKKMQYEEEKKKREEEKAAYLKKLEEEEAKKIPYEEEQNLCDFLADYLERTYLSTDENKKEEDKKTDSATAVPDDPFAGLTPAGKKSEEDEYFGKGKGKKKRVRAAKKQEAAGPFTLSVDSFEQFGVLGLTPPTSVEQVPNSVQELREKKEWYKQQPRGSVPTAKQIRQENEKSAAKLRQATETEGKKGTGKPPKAGTFSLSKDDFAPLGTGTTTSVNNNTSWGQKPTST
jgi:uncharacterized coiled-coil DUF342 family protein